MPRRANARRTPAWMGDLPAFERVLANGLKAIVLPRPSSAVVVSDLYYPVGSVDEPAGRSGLAHFTEHMLFKGTDRFPKGHIDRITFLSAGQANAETSEDFTHYWFALPTPRWEVALAVEVDRMRGARFDSAEVEAERHVIAEERAREMDSPLGRLDQHHLATSYVVHPYRNPILGWPEDLRRTTADELRGFYDTHYRPDGAVLVVVGDVDPSAALDRIEAHFGDVLYRGPDRLPPSIAEPRQSGRRDFELRESDGVARGIYGWHSAPRLDADVPALDVLSDILSVGRRSRLWARLVEKGRLATWVDASQESSRHAGQFLVQVEAAPGRARAEVEAAIRSEIDRLARLGPTAEELARSRNRLEAAWRWEQEDVAGLAAGLGQVALWGSWRDWQAEHRASLAVSADDVRRVAARHLIDDAMTVGWSLPRPARSLVVVPEVAREAEPIRRPAAPAPAGAPEIHIPPLASTYRDFRPRRSSLPNGLRLITERRPGTGTVAIDLFVDAGSLRESKPGVAFVAGRLREEGTTTRDAEDLALAIEDVGGSMEIGSTGVSFRIRSEDLALAADILGDLILRPAFPADALNWALGRTVAELKGDRDDPAFRADQCFRSMVYGTHPYGRDPRGNSRQIKEITIEDVRAHHDRFFRPNNAVLVVVGDFEPSRLDALLRRELDGWSAATGASLSPVAPPRAGRKGRLRRIACPAEQVQIVLGHLGVTRMDPDYDALVVLDHIFGAGPGFTDRLSRILRDELGLAYSVGGSTTESADLVPGVVRVHLATSPSEADRAVEAAIGQFEAMHRGEFDDDEVRSARQYLAGASVFDFQTIAHRVDRLLDLERFHLPLDHALTWPDRIMAVTPADVRRAAATHLRPSSLIRVELGPPSPTR